MNKHTAVFGDTLRQLRRALGLSQGALAGQLQSTQRHISFLETGRSQPTAKYLSRLCTELNLSAGQRANLFAASGLANPYVTRDMSSDAVIETLDMLTDRVLAHWPFPAFVLDPSWNILRKNTASDRVFGPFLDPLVVGNQPRNFLQLLMSEKFMAMVTNWHEASPAIYFRLHASAGRDPFVAQIFDTACARGLFDHLPSLITEQTEAPVYIPVELQFGEGISLRITSFIGQLATVQDALVEGFEIEFMIPCDAASERLLLELCGGAQP